MDSITNKNPYLIIITGDFNARSGNSWSKDKTTIEGARIVSLTCNYALNQLINEPIHILPRSSSCIDLMFTSQPNMVMESGVHSSLHPNCHHQIIFAIFNLKIYYPPPYERVVWHYDQADTDLIKRAINHFDWANAFLKLNINEQVSLFNTTIINIMNNFVPNETITCDDRDLPWVTTSIKRIIQQKNEAYRLYLYNNKNYNDFLIFKNLQRNLCPY